VDAENPGDRSQSDSLALVSVGSSVSSSNHARPWGNDTFPDCACTDADADPDVGSGVACTEPQEDLDA
jgi:hypothetical protein